jgi:hypothetical protein
LILWPVYWIQLAPDGPEVAMVTMEFAQQMVKEARE